MREDLIDPRAAELDRFLIGPEAIRRFNPQRFEMEQLSGVLSLDKEKGTVVGLRVVRDDEWWVRGHVPGQPIFPGMLMLESAAQLGNVYLNYPEGKALWGFAGVDGVRFRGLVVPGDRIVIAARALEVRRRACKFYFQGFVGEKRVVEGTVIGVLLFDSFVSLASEA